MGMEIERTSTFGAMVRRYRQALDLSQEDLAEKAGISLRTLNEIEGGGKHAPRPDTVTRLAEVLELRGPERTAFQGAARQMRDRALPGERTDGLMTVPISAGRLTLPPVPVPLTRLLGREAEVAAVSTRLRQDGVRLVTLTGAGGSGKTRFALAVAKALESSFPDGVAFVPLAPLTDPELVLPTLAHFLGLREVPGQSWHVTLRARLRGRDLLAVLDNFEHLLPATPALLELLVDCPGLKLLITSRSALRVSSEQEYPVPPLAVPDPRHPTPVEALPTYPSVALFLARAQAVDPAFQLTSATAPAVAAICQRLDGLPLAIELAAARIRIFGPEAMLARLAQRLPLLTGGGPDLPERQRTLRATLDWSYVLLDPAEQTLFARAAVFVDGFTLDAAEAVGAGERDAGGEVLDRLEGLVSQSLVQRGNGLRGEPRFVLLETIREYALERLEGSGEIAQVRRAHGAYFLALVEEAEPGLLGGEQETWVSRLEAEYGNLRSVQQWSDARGDAEAELRLSAALWRFWFMHGHLTEGRRWIEQALARGGGAPPGLRAKALRGAGTLAKIQGNPSRGRALLEQSLAIGRELGDQPGAAESLDLLGGIALNQAEYASARRLYGEALTIRRELGDRWGTAATLNNLGLLAEYQGNASLARTLLEESLGVARELGYRWGTAIMLANLGSVALLCDEHGQARTLIDGSLAIRQQLGDESGIGDCLEQLGVVAWAEGNYSQARSLLEESQAIQQRVGDTRAVMRTLNHLGNVAAAEGRYHVAGLLFAQSLRTRREERDWRGIAQCLEGLAGVAAMSEQPERAASLTGAAEALRDAVGAPPIPAERRAFNRTIATLRASRGDDAFEAERAVGRAMRVDLAIDEALDVPL